MTCKEDGSSTASPACPRLAVSQPNELYRETTTGRTRSWLKDLLCSTRFYNAFRPQETGRTDICQVQL
jgi:hypothetical protein